MAANVSIGEARAKSKTPLTYQGRAGQLYAVELPILVNGTERGFLDLEYFVADDLSNNAVAAHMGAGLYCRWIAS